MIVGDIKHSRVARSNVSAFAEMGANVTLVAPRSLLPTDIDDWPVEVTHDLDSVIETVDICYLLRMQLERQKRAYVPTLREFHTEWGLDSRRAALLPTHALIMHPGPMNRGVEIDGTVADRPNALMTEQVANGVAVRMAVLYLLLGSGLDLVDERLAVA